MLEEVPVNFLGMLTPGALLGLGIFFIMTGRLVPVKTHDRELLIRDQYISYMRDALDTYHENERRRANQISELLEHSRANTEIIKMFVADKKGEMAT